MIALALRLADAARAAIRPRFRARFAIEDKADGSPVTEVDKAVEVLLRGLIRDAFPDHGIIGEEGEAERPDAAWTWVLDPIDGTKSFILGKPTFATLIGLMHRGRSVLGVMEYPALEDRWIGALGRPTRWNGRPVTIRACPDLASAALSTTGPDWFTGPEISAYDALRERAKMQHWGGDSLSFGLLASGSIDLVAEASHHLHDWCAIAPVVEGAGGIMTDWTGAPLRRGSPSYSPSPSSSQVVAAGDARVHAEAVRHLSPAAAARPGASDV